MDSKELRIGNWVTFNGVEAQNGLIRKDTLGHNNLFYTSDLDDVQPIPLTEEWLVKFGFTFDETTNCYHYYNFILNRLFVMMDIDIHICLEHVHQLQNLYHALTGEELEIG
jgi:hypothetical protein